MLCAYPGADGRVLGREANSVRKTLVGGGRRLFTLAFSVFRGEGEKPVWKYPGDSRVYLSSETL